MSVIDFPINQPRIFVCDCGCSTFALLEDGEAQCANCASMVSGAHGTWFEAIEGAPDHPVDAEPPFQDVQGNGSVEFARARIARMASDDDVKLLVIARESGAVHVWSEAETEEQAKWTEEQLEAAAGILRKREYE